ncbi:MAG: hypothetical protein ACJAZO_004902 [Myxococcota bacterium]|jgi:hypothetical protein
MMGRQVKPVASDIELERAVYRGAEHGDVALIQSLENL